MSHVSQLNIKGPLISDVHL